MTQHSVMVVSKKQLTDVYAIIDVVIRGESKQRVTKNNHITIYPILSPKNSNTIQCLVDTACISTLALNREITVTVHSMKHLKYSTHKAYLFVGKHFGIAQAIYAAQHYRYLKPYVLLQANGKFPLPLCPSQFMLPGWPSSMIAGITLLDTMGIPSRICSVDDEPGCYFGTIEQCLKSIQAIIDRFEIIYF